MTMKFTTGEYHLLRQALREKALNDDKLAESIHLPDAMRRQLRNRSTEARALADALAESERNLNLITISLREAKDLGTHAVRAFRHESGRYEIVSGRSLSLVAELDRWDDRLRRHDLQGPITHRMESVYPCPARHRTRYARCRPWLLVLCE